MKKAIIITVLIIGLVIGSFFAGSYYVRYKARKQQKLINQGFQETAIQITQTGNIPVVINNTIQWITIQSLCGG